jgi:hypothetical protein
MHLRRASAPPMIWLVALLTTVSSCAPAAVKPGGKAPAAPLIAQTGPVAVVPATAPPSLKYIALPQPKEPAIDSKQTANAVAKGAAQGAVGGALMGAFAGLMIGLEFAVATGGLGVVIVPYTVTTGTAVGAVGGVALGAAGAINQNKPRGPQVPSQETLTPIPVHLPVAEAMVTAAQIQPQLQAQLPVPLLGTRCAAPAQLRTKQTGSKVVFASSADGNSKSTLKGQGYSSCVEVGITHLKWEEARDPAGPYLVLFATAQARMEDLALGKAPVSRDYWFESSRRYVHQPILSELQRAQSVLGERMAEDLLINAIGDGVIENGICGLVPAQTRFHDSGASASDHTASGVSGSVPVTYLNPYDPVLAWESFPTQRHLSVLALDGAGSPTDVVYDLRIWREGELNYAYERVGEMGSTHRLDPVPPAGEYRWSVRARFVYAGKPRATTWNYVWEAALADASAHIKAPQGGWVTCRRDYISDASSLRLIVPSP